MDFRAEAREEQLISDISHLLNLNKERNEENKEEEPTRCVDDKILYDLRVFFFTLVHEGILLSGTRTTDDDNITQCKMIAPPVAEERPDCRVFFTKELLRVSRVKNRE